jgi:hypothetical protein
LTATPVLALEEEVLEPDDAHLEDGWSAATILSTLEARPKDHPRAVPPS